MNTPDTYTLPDFDREPFRCLIIGVGGCGCAILNNMLAAEYGKDRQYGEVIYIALDSESATLETCKAEQKICIPKTALYEDEPELQEQLAAIPRADMVFVLFGMGGATGTKISPIVASYAKQRESLTIGVTALPLLDEGEQRVTTAKKGLSAFLRGTNSLIEIPMPALLSGTEETPAIEDVYAEADKAIITGITAIVDCILPYGRLIGMDFADLQTVFGNGGISRVSYGAATGKGRARQAALQAISSPMLGVEKLKRASGVLIVIVGDSTISLEEVSEVSNIFLEKCHEDAEVLFQTFYDGNDSALSVLVLACAKGAKDTRYGFTQRSFVDWEEEVFPIDYDALEPPAFIRWASSFGDFVPGPVPPLPPEQHDDKGNNE